MDRGQKTGLVVLMVLCTGMFIAGVLAGLALSPVEADKTCTTQMMDLQQAVNSGALRNIE
jgi:hypothetical protein